MEKIKINLNGLKNEESSRLGKDLFSILSYKAQIPKIKQEYQEINLEYENNNKNGIVRLFSNKFFMKNRNKFFLLIYNKKVKPLTIMKITGISGPIKIKMIITEPSIDMNYMFLNCSSLISFNSPSNKMTNMKYMFAKCSCLESVTIGSISDKNDDSPLQNERINDLINQNYSQNKKKSSRFNNYDLSHMFEYCKSLRSLSLNNFDIEEVENIGSLFEGCSSLISVPDISNWNTKNIIDMSRIFSGCKSLETLPDISKWNTKNVVDMKSLFSHCSLLKSLPDISKWYIRNVIDINEIFYGCSLLISLPDISKWEINNIINLKGIFSGCANLLSLPDISLWNTSNVNDMSYIS